MCVSLVRYVCVSLVRVYNIHSSANKGEILPSGLIGVVDGIEEKILACLENNIKVFYIPVRNAKNLSFSFDNLDIKPKTDCRRIINELIWPYIYDSKSVRIQMRCSKDVQRNTLLCSHS